MAHRVTGHHRSEDLAERHRAELAREYGEDVKIVARLDDDGNASDHGRTFVFEVEGEPPIEDLSEFFDAYDDADYFDEYDVETSPDYAMNGD